MSRWNSIMEMASPTAPIRKRWLFFRESVCLSITLIRDARLDGVLKAFACTKTTVSASDGRLMWQICAKTRCVRYGWRMNCARICGAPLGQFVIPADGGRKYFKIATNWDIHTAPSGKPLNPDKAQSPSQCVTFTLKGPGGPSPVAAIRWSA